MAELQRIDVLIERESTNSYFGGMERVIILGRGGSGKSTLAARIGAITGLPVIELDKIFWQENLTATPSDKWIVTQQELAKSDRWIMDGDLGRYDALEGRLPAADTVVFLDFSILRCAWRAFWRSRERADFWFWLLSYRRLFRRFLMREITRHAPNATFVLLRNPAAVTQFIAELTLEYKGNKKADEA